MKEPNTTTLMNDGGTLLFAEHLWARFCDDMRDDPNMAKVRLISGVQIAIRDALKSGHTVLPRARERQKERT
jgi:hypothetical protein